jgi:hypothetical protein|tara:strand:+ start:168 stop:617 length:450 start_codon:yes stop_codon:yes gene_type:complete
MRTITFRGLLKDQAQERIRLQTLAGKMGYKIKKLQLFPNGATSAFNYESFVSIFSVKQTTIPADANPSFSDQLLLACGYYTQSSSGSIYPEDLNIVFDGVTFNQDIFISHSNSDGNESINYYLELEQIRLDDMEASAVILKNFRNTNTV